jgi:hypothetical protein
MRHIKTSGRIICGGVETIYASYNMEYILSNYLAFADIFHDHNFCHKCFQQTICRIKYIMKHIKTK